MVELSESDIKKILLNSSNSDKFSKYEIKRLSDKPVGYLADHFILRIYQENSKKIESFFLKAAPRDVVKRFEYLEETNFFTKEVQLYQELLPLMLKNSSLSWAAECYLAKDKHFIIMENLNDFKTFPSKNLTFDFDHLNLSVKTLACFHATSIILEEKNGFKFGDKYNEMLSEAAYPKSPENHIRRKGLENAIEVLSELLRLIPELRESPYYEKIIQAFPDKMRLIYKFSETSKTYRNVVSHGDLWVNNLMFSYHENQDKPKSCKFVDFQLARYAPPSIDLADLIYINSTRNLRENRLNEIINTYCKTFDNELKKANVSTDKLKKKEILSSFKKFRLSGLINAALFGHLTLLPPTMSTNILSSSEEYDKFINQSRIKTCLKAFEEDYYRERLSEILIEIVEVFILPEFE